MMTEHNAENERVKHRYRVRLQDAEGYSDGTIDQALAAIHAFEEYTGFLPFRRFHFEQARAFTRNLKTRTNPKTGKLYSKATLNGILGALRKFFKWLGGQQDFQKHVTISDADFFRLNEKDARIARATRLKHVPSVKVVQQVIASMPFANDIQKRDRAVVAFTLLTGARVGAIISAKLKHVDLTEGLFFQDAREVKTKFSKTFTTWFFPVGGQVREIVEEWVIFLITERGYGPDDPLFPTTQLAHDENRQFVPAGLSQKNWKAGQAVRNIIRAAFVAQGLPPPNPHVIRDTLNQLGMQVCGTYEEFKAWSQNLGHDHVQVSLKSYGTVEDHRQAELIRKVGKAVERSPGEREGVPDAATVEWVVEHLMSKAL